MRAWLPPSSNRAAVRWIAVLVALLLSWPTLAQRAPTEPVPPASTRGRVVQVSDGDTFYAVFGDRRLKVRLANADTPETGLPGSVNAAKCPEEMEAGKRAAAYVRDLVAKREVVAVSLGRWDKYGDRVVATVTVSPGVDGRTDLADILVYMGLGRFYKGERRMTWCPER